VSASAKPAARVRLAKSIGSRVREERTRVGLTQGELAERAGIHRENVNRMERGRHLPDLEVLVRVAAALEVCVADLLPA
jgi:transcriptional regulator with XRE-family HTH domain